MNENTLQMLVSEYYHCETVGADENSAPPIEWYMGKSALIEQIMLENGYRIKYNSILDVVMLDTRIDNIMVYDGNIYIFKEAK